MAYTENQEKVVNSRGSNLLVSAAAGSGKTFVLTGHVINRILDHNPEYQIDVDRMLIITFTEAASLEMKQRIEKAINEELVKDPGNSKLLRQRALIPGARISTTDSFFSWVVKTYFDKSEIDPEYKIDTSGQLELLKKDVFDKLFEEVMSRGNKDFEKFLDAFIPDKSLSRSLYELVKSNLEVYSSVSDREEFCRMIRESCKNNYKSIDDIPLTKWLTDYYKSYCESVVYALRSFANDSEMDRYSDYIVSAIEQFEGISCADSFEEIIERVKGFSLPKYPSLKNKTFAEEAFAEFRDSVVRDFAKDFCDEFAGDSLNDMLLSVNNNGSRLNAYFDFFLEYVDALYQAKLDANIMDFSDISHEAYRIIRDNPDVREELSEKFKLVIVDEYQDTNHLQEDAISLIANRNNYYMIGDIKQSIYGFRQASPEIFAEKYNSFGDRGNNIKIELSDNFRSRKNVLTAVNSVFERIMFKTFGGITYDDEAALKYGASDLYDETDSHDYDAELLLYSSEENADGQRAAQAKIVVSKIKELVGKSIVVDKDKSQRVASYKDIVILSRNLTNIKYVTDELKRADISYSVNMKRGYFDSVEVQQLLSLLRIIDNPHQNQYMLAVLTGPIGGFSDAEIAELVANYKLSRMDRDDISLYDALVASEDSKSKRFVEAFAHYRAVSKYTGVYELLEMILNDTDYIHYINALPDSELRRANVELLSQKARDFENSSYSGVFDFINYIDRFIKNKGDLKESNTSSEADNVVRIMTIHGSKGLEFPIVFLINCGDDLTKSRGGETSISFGQNGLCAPYVDLERSIKVKTLPQLASKKIAVGAELSEEMRLLYVAMTRAREKLYIVAGKKLTKKFNGLIDNKLSAYFDGFYPECIGRLCKSYFDMIRLSFSDKNIYIRHSYYSPEDVQSDDAQFARSREDVLKEFHDNRDKSFDGAGITELVLELKPNYVPRPMKAAYSVSELKHAAMEEAFTGEPADAVLVPQIEGLGGAELGSAYHLVMEKVDPAMAADEAYVSSVIKRLTGRGLIDEKTAEKIKPSLVTDFYKQSIGSKVIAAYKEGALTREHEFVLSLPASAIDKDAEDMDVPIIVQGIIDMFYISDGKITIIDYKTDRILPGQEDILVGHYKKQLELYAKALTSHFNLPIERMYLYSFALGKFIEV